MTLARRRTVKRRCARDDRHDNRELCKVRKGYGVSPESIKPFHGRCSASDTAFAGTVFRSQIAERLEIMTLIWINGRFQFHLVAEAFLLEASSILWMVQQS